MQVAERDAVSVFDNIDVHVRSKEYPYGLGGPVGHESEIGFDQNSPQIGAYLDAQVDALWFDSGPWGTARGGVLLNAGSIIV